MFLYLAISFHLSVSLLVTFHLTDRMMKNASLAEWLVGLPKLILMPMVWPGLVAFMTARQLISDLLQFIPKQKAACHSDKQSNERQGRVHLGDRQSPPESQVIINATDDHVVYRVGKYIRGVPRRRYEQRFGSVHSEAVLETLELPFRRVRSLFFVVVPGVILASGILLYILYAYFTVFWRVGQSLICGPSANADQSVLTSSLAWIMTLIEPGLCFE